MFSIFRLIAIVFPRYRVVLCLLFRACQNMYTPTHATASGFSFRGAWGSWRLHVARLHLERWTICYVPFFLVSKRGRRNRSLREEPCANISETKISLGEAHEFRVICVLRGLSLNATGVISFAPSATVPASLDLSQGAPSRWPARQIDGLLSAV